MTVKNVSFRIRTQYFDAIVNGEKKVEFRKDTTFWRKRLLENRKPAIAVFVCSNRVHRRWITDIATAKNPYGPGSHLNEQIKKDIPTENCIAIFLGDEIT